MKIFEERKWNIGELKGISKKSIEEHIGLYSGYVKNTNLIIQKLDELRNDTEKNQYIISELQRRFSFEFCGMRNHEIYFDSLESGGVDDDAIHNIELAKNLKQKIEKDFGDFSKWLNIFKNIATTRGVGWAILYYDKKTDQLINAWIDEQHLGQLTGLTPLLALDMWEHSYVADYLPSGKKKYIEDFFQNINWTRIENNFLNI